MKQQLLSLFLGLFSTAFAFAQVPQSEREALIDLYNATGGSSWNTSTNWDLDPNSTSDVSTWYGVETMSSPTRTWVSKIELPGNNLSGSIPATITNLSGISALNLSNNDITGALDISSIYIVDLDMSSTNISQLNLSETIAAQTFNIKETPNLYCIGVPDQNTLRKFNNLTGDRFDVGDFFTPNCGSILPLAESDREVLEELFATFAPEHQIYIRTYSHPLAESNNTLFSEGIMTIDINGERKIQELRLDNLGIETTPTEKLGNLSELTYLDLSRNRFNGLPATIQNLSKLKELYLNNNSSLINLPPEIGALSALEELYMQQCRIDLLPATIGDLSNLKIFNFSNNNITLIPPSIGNLTALTELYAAPNPIASIPSQVGNLTNLRILDFSNSELSNTPSELANLTNLEVLYLNNNNIQIVEGLSGFTKLRALKLDHNRLGRNGNNLPDDLGNLTQLTVLTLNQNELTVLPNTIGGLSQVVKLPLDYNKLTALPESIGQMSSLEELSIADNQLTTLPASIGDLSNLRELHLSSSNASSGNRLESLPEEIGNLSNLELLYINDQRTYDTSINAYVYHLTSLPASINNLTNLKDFRAINNGLAGNLDLSNLTQLSNLHLYSNELSGLKLGAPSSNFSRSSFQLYTNPNLSCIEVETDDLAGWQQYSTANPTLVDNGVAFSDDCTGYRVPQLEREALIAIYNATGGGTEWTAQFWDPDPAGLTNVGAWQGVTTELVNGQKHVVELDLGSNRNLTGAIPAEIGNLSELRFLNLSSGSITTLPDEIGDLGKLTSFWITNNKLTSLPAGIGNFASLVEFRVSNQSLSQQEGYERTLTSLPDELGDIATLEKLDLSSNGLTSLPAGIGNFSTLKELNIGYQADKGSGEITRTLTELPTEIGNISSLEVLRLMENGLTTLPASIGDLSNLRELHLSSSNASSGNKLESLPEEIGNLSNLELLYINDQRTYDTSINAYVYHLTSLPASINNLTNLKDFRAINNGLAGNLDLSNLTQLSNLHLYANELSGLKLGAPSSNFSRSSFQLYTNPNLSCIEVETDDLAGWQQYSTANPTLIDNGVAFSDDCTGYRVPQIEREALIAIYNATGGGTEWNAQFWDPDPAGLTNVGAWQGVTTELVNGQKHVVELDLGSNRNLTGAIPAEIGNLSELRFLNLSSGSITALPDEIGDLGKLTSFFITSNKLTSLPAGIGNFASLVEFRVSNQSLGQQEGYERTLTSLPDELGDIATLEKLDLSSNGLTSLPAGIGNFSTLKELNIGYQADKGSGEITRSLTELPTEIGNISSLEVLRLMENGLTTLPASIGDLSNLRELHLSSSNASSGNKLESLPEEIGNLSNLELLYINDQRTYDTNTNTYIYHLEGLPLSLNNLTNLKDFRATNNGLAGNLDLSNLTQLSNLHLYSNELSGLKLGAPSSNFSRSSFQLYTNPNLSCIEVETDDLAGWQQYSAANPTLVDNGVAFSDDCTGYRVPQVEREALIAIYNATGGGTEWNAQFWDPDPAGLTNVGAWQGVTTELVNGQKHVVELDLGSNRNLTGAIPAEIGNLSELRFLNLSSGSITTLPDEIGDLGKLTSFWITNNKLTSLPAGIGNFASLVEFRVSNQSLSQQESYERTLTSLPDELGNIETLEKLDLSYNGLTSLPAGIGNFSSLKELSIGYQADKGSGEITRTLTELPTEIGNISSLEVLRLMENGLTTLPASIGDLSNLKVFEANNNYIKDYLDLGQMEVLNTLKLQYNHLNGLKLAVSPSIFNSNGNNYFNITRNALGCIEVPTEELVSWQLSDFTEANNNIDNGVIYSDNCGAVTNNSIPQSERDALIALYHATTGDEWKNDLSSTFNGVPWDVEATNSPNVGAWFGVQTAVINDQKHVVEIDMRSNELTGIIPVEIKDLTMLKVLSLPSNSLSEIPTEIGLLANLEKLDISSQRDDSDYILKDIPVEINNLTALKSLNISGNKITRVLDFSNLVNLNHLAVTSSEITGLKIGVGPDNFDGVYNADGGFYNSFSFSSNPHLSCIAVPQNTVSDWEGSSYANNQYGIIFSLGCDAYNSVPQEELDALIALYNATSGENWTNNENWNSTAALATDNVSTWHGITTEIVNGGKHVTRVYLNSNMLNGTLPEQLSDLQELKTLQISSNQLSGAVPNLSGITSLEALQISSNAFQFGDFEDEFEAYSQLTTFSYSGQAEVGESDVVEVPLGSSYTLTAEVSGANNEYQWYRNNTEVENATEASLTLDDIQQTQLGSYFCRVTNTVVTNLTIRTASTTLTEDFVNGSLTAFYTAMDGDNWTDNTNWLSTEPLDTWYGVTTNEDGAVIAISLAQNNLTGTLTTELDALEDLESINLEENNISGTIPQSIGDFTFLYNLSLNDNQFSGSIPASLGDLYYLESLDISNNELEGIIPETLSYFDFIQEMNFASNMLSGTIPNLVQGAGVPHIDISNNDFIFDDLDANFETLIANSASFLYAPMNPFNEPQDVDLEEGADITLTAVFDNGRTSREALDEDNVYQWYKDDVAIDGAQENTYTISNANNADAGIYTCKVTNAAIPDLELISSPIEIAVMLGVDESLASAFKVYPNPVVDQFYIDLDSYNHATFSIYDLQGKQLLKGELKQRTTIIDIQNLQSGIYLCKIKQGDATATVKVVKQ